MHTIAPPSRPRTARRHDDISVITALGLVEGEILDYLDRCPQTELADLPRALGIPPRVALMAVGGLVREHLVRVTQHWGDILIEPVSACERGPARPCSGLHSVVTDEDEPFYTD